MGPRVWSQPTAWKIAERWLAPASLDDKEEASASRRPAATPALWRAIDHNLRQLDIGAKEANS